MAAIVDTVWCVRSAIVWGSSAKHARGQKVGLDHILEDEDGKFRVLIYQDPSSTTSPQLFTSQRSEVGNSKISSITALRCVSYTTLPPNARMRSPIFTSHLLSTLGGM